MVQFLLLLFALYRWFHKDRVTFYLIIQFIIFRCYNWLPESGIRSDDLALVAVVLTGTISLLKGSVVDRSLARNIGWLIVLVFSIFCISISYYKLPLNEVISGARHYLFVLCIFDICKMNYNELHLFFKRLFYLNIVACALFIVYTFTHIPIYHSGYVDDKLVRVGFLGLKRVYTFPQLTAFACSYSVFLKGYRSLSGKLCMAIAFACLLCIQSRGMIMNVAVAIALGYLVMNKKSSSKSFGLLFILLAALFIKETIFSGETGQKTLNDFSQIFSGDVFRLGYESEGNATFTYRMTLLVATVYRMIEASWVSLLFGFGFFVELPLKKIADLGLLNLARESWNGYGLFTPDISYVNILCNLGFLGLFVYLRFFVLIAKKTYLKIKKEPANKYALISFIYVLYLLLVGLDGSSITYPSSLLIPFLLLHVSNVWSKFINTGKINTNENCTHRVGVR